VNIKGGTKEVEDLQGYVSEALKAIIGPSMTKQRGPLMAGFRVAGPAPERPTCECEVAVLLSRSLKRRRVASLFPFPTSAWLRNWHFTFATGASTDRNLSELSRARSSFLLSAPKRENDDSFQLIRTSLSRLPLRGWIE
jgi:hypothetical protein